MPPFKYASRPPVSARRWRGRSLSPRGVEAPGRVLDDAGHRIRHPAAQPYGLPFGADPLAGGWALRRRRPGVLAQPDQKPTECPDRAHGDEGAEEEDRHHVVERDVGPSQVKAHRHHPAHPGDPDHGDEQEEEDQPERDGGGGRRVGGKVLAGPAVPEYFKGSVVAIPQVGQNIDGRLLVPYYAGQVPQV